VLPVLAAPDQLAQVFAAGAAAPLAEPLVHEGLLGAWQGDVHGAHGKSCKSETWRMENFSMRRWIQSLMATFDPQWTLVPARRKPSKPTFDRLESDL
jgi:hypothetical protein